MTQLLNIISCGIKSFRFKVSICNQAGGDLLCAIPVSYIMLYPSIPPQEDYWSTAIIFHSTTFLMLMT